MNEPSSERDLNLAAANDPSITSLVFPAWDEGEQWAGQSRERFKNALRNTTHVESVHVHIPVGPLENEINRRLWVDFCKVLGNTKSVNSVHIQLVGRSEGPQETALNRGPTRLEVFKLERFSCFDTLAYKYLFESLALMPSLKNLELCPDFMRIREDDAGSGKFSNVGGLLTLLESLTLSCFKFDERDCNDFRYALEGLEQKGAGLEKLHLHSCRGIHFGSPSLLSATGCLTTLILTGIALNTNGLDTLTEEVRTPHKLRELSLLRTNLDLEGTSLREAEQCVQRFFKELKRQNLHQFVWAYSETLAQFPGAFQFLPHFDIVPRLSFAHCYLGREAMEEIIRRVPCLEGLSVFGNMLDETLLRKLRCEISGAGRTNSSLEGLEISLDNLGSPQDRLDSAASIIENCDLTWLSVCGIKKGLLPSSNELLSADRLLDALRGNYTLEDLYSLRFDAQSLDDLDGLGSQTQYIIRNITKLNKVGRGYLATNAPSRRKGVEVLASVSDDLDCLFYHLLENPSLCRFHTTSPRNKGDDIETKKIGLLEAAEGGHTKEMMSLSTCYLKGTNGFNRDAKLAFEWAEKAHAVASVVLENVLSFLDARSLAAADQTCTALRRCSQDAWKSLYESSISYHDTRDTPLTKKQRVLRFLKQQCFSRRMERLAGTYSHYPSYHQGLRCLFPDIERDTYGNFAEYDYFLRLSQEREGDLVLLWEGFVTPPQNLARRGVGGFPHNQRGGFLFFDMSSLHEQVSTHWRYLPEFFCLWRENGRIWWHKNSQAYLGGAFGNVFVTVTAMRRAQPWTSKLLGATRNFEIHHRFKRQRRIYVCMKSRNTRSHAYNDREDGVFARLVFEVAGSETRVGKFLGVELFCPENA